MSALVARLLLSMSMLPLAAIVYFAAYFFAYELTVIGPFRDERAMLWAGLATSVFVAAYWLGVWGRSVRWTQTRTLLTVVSGIAALALAAVAGLIFSDFEREVGYFIGTTLAPMIWVILTILIWRETAYERSLRLEASGLGTIVCPHCGYNLTGLVEARCPECGTKYTLDDLLRRQPARAMAAEL